MPHSAISVAHKLRAHVTQRCLHGRRRRTGATDQLHNQCVFCARSHNYIVISQNFCCSMHNVHVLWFTLSVRCMRIENPMKCPINTCNYMRARHLVMTNYLFVPAPNYMIQPWRKSISFCTKGWWFEDAELQELRNASHIKQQFEA